jgi:myosin heavy subunit
LPPFSLARTAWQERYNENIIYTYTGPILLAINPFWRVPLYTNKILEQYRRDGQAKSFDPDFRSNLPPHVYAIADNAYRLMTNPTSENQKRNQSILVSGESGAGKTETTKIIMKYLAILGGHDSKAILEGDSSVVSIEQQVLQSNPILEAFGNARTVRNDNSSRFGKFIEIDFDKDGFLVGAAIRTFLLEKIRIVHTGENERNFHIFYLMLAGAPKEQLAGWRLSRDPRTCHYINQSGCYLRRDGVKDAELWEELQQAMKMMEFSEAQKEEVFGVVAGVLHCGNANFEDVDNPDKGDEMVGEPTAETMKSIENAAELLQVKKDDLVRSMTSRTIKAGTEWVTMYLDAEKCRHLRNALTKAIYSGLFDWLVAKINETIDRQHGGTGLGSSPTGTSFFSWAGSPNRGGGQEPMSPEELAAGPMFIGLLDIFGFESFEHNYFEQFLINYANEKLQQQFNHFVFEMEQEEYKRECIKWDFIEFPDNKASIDLIEAKPAGILALLDEQCIVPRATDDTLARNMYKYLNDHSRFKAGADLRVDHKFMVNHYAGDITYETEGFLEKNRDVLHQEAINLLNSSNSEIVKGVGSAARCESTPRRAGGAKTVTKVARQSSIVSQSVGAQFRSQLNSLLGAIDETHPHYIRCLKPNDRNQRSLFDRPRITSQLANGGVLAAVRVARAGFPVRMAHREFITRYGILFVKTLQAAQKQAAKKCQTKLEAEKFVSKELIIDCIPLLQGAVTLDTLALSDSSKRPGLEKGSSFRDLCGKGGVQMGESKVFFRQTAFNRAEKARTLRLGVSCTRIQTAFRRHRCRQVFTRGRFAAVALQAYVRGRQARLRYLEARYLRATIRVQSFVRAALCCRQYARQLRASRRIQTCYRRHACSSKYSSNKLRTIALQCVWRRRKARRQLQFLKKEAAEVSSLQAKIKAYEDAMKAKEEEMRLKQEEAMIRMEAQAKEAAEAARQQARAEAAREAQAAREAEEERRRIAETAAAATAAAAAASAATAARPPSDSHKLSPWHQDLAAYSSESGMKVGAPQHVPQNSWRMEPMPSPGMDSNGRDQSFSFSEMEPDDMISISIDKATVAQVSASTQPVVLYRIRVKTTRRNWAVERRFSDFMWLHDTLADAFDASELPRPPARRIFGDKMDREFIEERRMHLQDYLVELLAEKGHWLTEPHSDRVEVGVGFNRRVMKQMVAKQSLMAFLDQRQPSLQRDEDSVMAALSSSVSSLFNWKR